jgi:hypothetical protein
MKTLADLRRRVLGAFRTPPTLNYAALSLCFLLGASGARANIVYDITFYSGGTSVVGTGTFSTNGSCTVCFRSGGLLSFTASFPPDPIFTSTDFDSASLFFDPAPLAFEADSGITNFPAVDTCPCYDLFFNESPGNTWETVPFVGGGGASGTYTIAAVPEPSSFILLVTGVVLLGFLSHGKWRLILSLPGALAKQSAVVRGGRMHGRGRTAPKVVGKFIDAFDQRAQHPTPGQ